MKQKQIDPLPLSKYTYREVIAEWSRQRREYFITLHASGMSYSKIARDHGLVRQAVSLMIKGKMT